MAALQVLLLVVLVLVVVVVLLWSILWGAALQGMVVVAPLHF